MLPLMFCLHLSGSRQSDFQRLLWNDGCDSGRTRTPRVTWWNSLQMEVSRYFMMKMNNEGEYSCIISARERTTVPSLRAKRPLVSTTSQRCAGHLTWIKRDKLSMTRNADSKWCEWAGGSHGSHLAEGRPLWNDDARFGEDLERRFKKKTRPRKHIIALSREVCVGHLEHGCKDLQHLAAGIWRRDPSCWCQVSQKFPLFRKVWLPLVLTPTLSCGTQTRLGPQF